MSRRSKRTDMFKANLFHTVIYVILIYTVGPAQIKSRAGTLDVEKSKSDVLRSITMNYQKKTFVLIRASGAT
jgi:hypothetical protein